MRADLHLHTRCSDGSLTPEIIIGEAVKSGLGLVAVTDHDCAAAIGGLRAAAEGTGVKTVAGVEISAYCGKTKFHTLGYAFDEQKLQPFLRELYESSLERAEDITRKLNAVGYDIDLDEVMAERYSGECPVHAENFARVMLRKGYISKSIDFYRKFIAVGKPAFSIVRRPTPEQAVEAIVAAGGLAVVAHPGRIWLEEEELEKKIENLTAVGLGGIEVYYTTHTEEKTVYYGRLADRLGLIKTGGSDTHHLDGSRAIGKLPFEADGRLLRRLNV